MIAGQGGNENAFVMALSMAPIKIQIADIVAENIENKKIPWTKKDNAMIASIVTGQIIIEKVSKTSIQDVNSLLKQFEQSKEMMRQMKSKKGFGRLF